MNAASLTFLAIAFSLQARRSAGGKSLVLTALLASAAATLGLWDYSFPVAPLIFFGSSALIYRAIRGLVQNPNENYRIFPVSMTMVFFAGFISLWQFELQKHSQYQKEMVANEAEKVRLEIYQTLKQTSLALERFALRVEYLGVRDKKYLTLDSHSYLDQLPILKRIGITDSSYRVVWSYPPNIDSQVQGFKENQDPVRKAALDDARENHHSSLSKTIELRSGSAGFLLPVALYPANRFAGFVYATIEADKLFHSYEESQDFQVLISEDALKVFDSDPQKKLDEALAQSRHLIWGQTDWLIKITPTAHFISNSQSISPYFILIFGIAGSMLFGLFLQAFFLSKRDAATEAKISLDWRKSILNGTQYSIISTDAQGVIQTFNSASAKMFGYDPSEVIGKATPAILHVREEVIERAETLSRELGRKVEPGLDTFTAKAVAKQGADESEWTFVRKDGTRLCVSLSLSVLHNAQGEISGYIGVSIDLTERKKAQEEIRITTERLERVVKASGEGIWEREYGTSNDQIYFMDSQAKKIFGFPADASLTFEEVRTHIHPAELERTRLAILDHVENGSPNYDVEFQMLNPTLSEQDRWIHARGQILHEAGKASRLISTIRDVTEEVRKRNQLKNALKAANEASQAKAEFLASMSHEIRTPLNGVIGMADLLMDTTLEAEQKNYATIIQQSGASLLLLINDILDLSKIEAGKLEFEQAHFSVAQVVQNHADILIAKAKEKNLSLMTYIAPDLPSEVKGDPGRIGQILLNLMGNGIKFTASGGVSVFVTHASSEKKIPHRHLIRFEVRDTGIGLSPTSIKKLFQPFVQATETTARKYGGTGLGLSICKRLAELMGGEIGVESINGSGSCFWFELPFEAVISSVKTEPVLSHPEKLRALIIDDDSVTRVVIEKYLRAWGFLHIQGTAFADARVVLEKAHAVRNPFQLAFVGPSSEHDLKSLGTLPKTILMTEFGQKNPNSFFKSSYSVQKPVKQSALFDAIAQTLSDDNVVRTAPIPEKETQAKTAALVGGRILIADDVAVNQLLATRMLEKYGCTCHCVGNGKEVLEALERVEYDLILMDCQMPEMDGFQATREIRAHANPQIRGITIIALTANAMSGDEKACTEAGMNDYLTKPIKKEALKAKLDHWLTPLRSHAKKTA